ncbi:MAG: hypothetical protein AB7F65_08825 [Dehalococcoidia bacterium]
MTDADSVQLSDEVVLEICGRLLEWGRDNYRDFPWRHRSIPRWQALVAEFLLLRTRASQVVPVFRRIQAEYPTAKALGDASEQSLIELVTPLGLRWRGRLFVTLAREIGQRRGRLPSPPSELRQMAGVGDYVAAAVLALHSDRRAVLIDSNIVRLIARLVGRPHHGETRRERWLRDIADRLTPETEFREYGYAVLDHSMNICRPRRPLCEICPLVDLCSSAQRREQGANEVASY